MGSEEFAEHAPAAVAASATSTPVPQKQEVLQQAAGAVQQQPITSPLPNTPAAAAPPAAFATQLSTSSIDEALIMPDEEVPEPESPQGGN